MLNESYVNGARSVSFTPSIVANYRPTPDISISAFDNVGVLYFYLRDRYLDQKNTMFNFRANINATLPLDFYAGGTYSYTQGTPSLRSADKHSHLYSLYVTKRMMKGKLSISAAANQPLSCYNLLQSSQWGEGYEQQRSNWITARSFGLRQVYNFGYGNRRSVERNHSLTTTDLDRATGVR